MSASNFIFLKPQLAEFKAGSDTTSEVSSYGSYGSSEDLQKIAVILGLGSVEEVYQERFRIDRRRLESMMADDLEENKTATYFFKKVMDSTKTVINWPTRLKIGARSKKDPHVRVSGKIENVKAAREKITQLLDTKSNRVTMKLDVSYTDHSHIIGKGGLTIKRVMEETGCHIHFPDSNRSNATEKSNQVSIAGEMENVEMARARVRALTPLLFSFELPVVTTGQDMADASSPYVARIQEQFKVQSGFPFEEDSGSEDVWNDLASRHPDIAARIRAGRDGTWGGRKRRSSQQPDDFSRNVDDHFHGFPFDDIPPEFRQHFPSRWGDRFAQRSPQEPKHRPREKEVNVETSPAQTSTQEIATQTTENPPLCTEATPTRAAGIPHYGLRNTVDLGQKTPSESGQIDRSQRSMSAPPDNRPEHQKQQMPPPQQMQQPQPQQMQQPPPQQMQQPQPQPQQTQPQHHQQQQQQPNVRHIPIFVEGRDEPVVNKNPTTATNHNPEPREASPQPPEREMHIPFSQPSHFSKAFGAPFKGFKSQPFGQRPRWDDREIPKVFKPTSKSPPPQQQPQQQPPQPQQQPQQPQQQPQQQPRPKTEPPPREASPQPQKPPSPADPIVKIQLIQKDVLDLMSQVEKFQGHGRKDKHYLYLDEMLTRNLIKLDDIDTDGKENIRQARKEAIKCIQKCIAVLEAKADAPVNTETGPDAEMSEAKNQNGQSELQNGEVEDKPPSVTAPMEVDQPSQQ